MTKRPEELYSLGIPHNVYSVSLPDGTFYPDYISQADDRPVQFLTQFNRVRDKDWSECSFIDLGCSEGSTTFGLGQMGSTIYGVEGREDAVRRARVLREIVGFDNVSFSVGNVTDPGIWREVDGVFAAGILYHLEDPIGFLQRCAAHARSFVYIDTGHAPRTEAELAASHFPLQFGARHTLHYEGIEIDAIDFAEPEDTTEKQEGRRRGPRSGIGNKKSVWISHAGMIRLFAKFGFAYHDTVMENWSIPRVRTCFFRTPPRPVAQIALTQPLPPRRPLGTAMRISRLRDLKHLHEAHRPVVVLGQQPLLGKVVSYLADNAVETTDVIELPGLDKPPVKFRDLQQLLKDKGGYIVLAVEEPHKLYINVMLLDHFDYAFTSFSMALALAPEEDRLKKYRSTPDWYRNASVV